MTDSQAGMQTTTINRGWMTKMVVICLFMFGLGAWGLYDGLKAYPERGERAASFFQHEYLRQLDAKGDGSILTKSSVADPDAEFDRLDEGMKSGLLKGEDLAKYKWLEQLKMIGKLKPEYTTVSDARKTLNELGSRWSTSNTAPQELSWYDIPAQWLISAFGLGFAIYLIGLVAVVRATRYGWEADAQRLHLPSGATLVPADIEVFDKRRWDKFLIFLKIKDSHQTLGGREISLDLLRYSPLEEWVLAMERTAFPESAEDAEKGESPSASAEADSAAPKDAS